MKRFLVDLDRRAVRAFDNLSRLHLDERARRLLNALLGSARARPPAPLVTARPPSPLPAADGAVQRDLWVAIATKLAEPVLNNLATGRLRRNMPVSVGTGRAALRRPFAHFEAAARLLAGLAPWLESGGAPAERPVVTRLTELACAGVAALADPASPDRVDLAAGRQGLVDAAHLAQALVRAPRALAAALPSADRDRVVALLTATRSLPPVDNNWVLFPAQIEAALHLLGAPWERRRVTHALERLDRWYLGDGVYGDGPLFAWNLYNSFVIHPMLLDTLRVLGPALPDGGAREGEARRRARRHAEVLERLVAPDGSFPVVGRSASYRAGAFHLLAQLALHHDLPPSVTPAQVRCALTAVLDRTLTPPGTFDPQGWLNIGLAGHQPELGESYVSTGSLYATALALLPLGLPLEDEFWSAPPADWTGRRAWAGAPVGRDAALD